MAGEGIYGYGSNPFYQIPGAQQPAQVQVPYTPTYLSSGTSFRGELENDTYESNGSGLVTGTLITATGAGAGAAAGYYLYGNPISKGEKGKLEVNQKLYEAYDNASKQAKITDAIEEAKLEKMKAQGITSKDQYEAVKKAMNAESFDALDAETKAKLPASVTNKAQAKAIIDVIDEDIAKIDAKAIAEKVTKEFTDSKKALAAQADNWKTLQEEVKKLGKSATPEDIKKFVTDNKELFGIKGEEAAVTTEIDRLSAMSKKDLAKYIKEQGTACEAEISNFNKEILKHVKKDSKVLADSASDVLKNAFKEFQWSQVKRLGLIGAGVGAGVAIITSLFGGNKNRG